MSYCVRWHGVEGALRNMMGGEKEMCAKQQCCGMAYFSTPPSSMRREVGVP